jgi:hypothetical protein
MSIITDYLLGRVIETGSDTKMGRWSYIRLLGKHGQNFIVGSVYQVCNQQASAVGDQTAFTQQLSLLRCNIKDSSTRKSFLTTSKNKLKNGGKGYKIILSGDLNKELGVDIHGFAWISAKWNLVKVIQHFHGVTDKPPTYAQGT